MTASASIFSELHALAKRLCFAKYYVTFIMKDERVFSNNVKKQQSIIEEAESFEICKLSTVIGFTWKIWPLRWFDQLTVVAKVTLEEKKTKIIITTYSKEALVELRKMESEHITIRLKEKTMVIYEFHTKKKKWLPL